jgi:hypothetical protein
MSKRHRLSNKCKESDTLKHQNKKVRGTCQLLRDKKTLRTLKESEQVRGTYKLLSREGETS